VDQDELNPKLRCQRVEKKIGLLKFRVIAGANTQGLVSAEIK
jgi:hypothetical protein